MRANKLTIINDRVCYNLLIVIQYSSDEGNPNDIWSTRFT